MRIFSKKGSFSDGRSAVDDTGLATTEVVLLTALLVLLALAGGAILNRALGTMAETIDSPDPSSIITTP